jgi:hypothetical protein
MVVSYYEYLVSVEAQQWNLDTVLRGASEQLTPIRMNAKGRWLLVILGGLFSSAALNLLVLPTLALALWQFL